MRKWKPYYVQEKVSRRAPPAMAHGLASYQGQIYLEVLESGQIQLFECDENVLENQKCSGPCQLLSRIYTFLLKPGR